MYDSVIIGAGPAGLTAAIYLLRAGKSTLILERDAFGGQMATSPKIENYPGSESVRGDELADKMVSSVLSLGADIEVEEALLIEKSGDGFCVKTVKGEYPCRTVIIATGARHRRLGLPGEQELIGEGVSFCAVCDGAFYKNSDVVVVGGGNSAKQAEDTCCDSFEKRKSNTTSNTMADASSFSSIDCKAQNCMYNEGCQCHAGKISVEGGGACRCQETACATFQKEC